MRTLSILALTLVAATSTARTTDDTPARASDPRYGAKLLVNF